MNGSNKQSADLSRLRIDKSLKNSSSNSGKIILWIIVFCSLALTGWYFLLKDDIETIEITEVILMNDRVTGSILNASGYVTPRRRATVAAKVTGRVSELFIEEGMQVEENQILARIDSTDALKELEAVKADWAVAKATILDLKIKADEAKRNLKRLQSLFDRQMISQQELDNIRTEVDSLNARIDLAKTQAEATKARVLVYEQGLENYTIRAPFAGVVVSKDAQIGEMVSPVSAGGGYTRTGIATIVDMNSLEIEVDINESYIAKVTPGQIIGATLDAYPDWEIPGSVRTVIPTADRQKATVKVRISFDTLDPKILPDMGIKVSFMENDSPLPANSNPRLTVKKEAIFQEANRPVVFVYKDGIIERREITIGEAVKGSVEILSGLMAGDQLVINPNDSLKDGMKVRLKKND